MKENIKVFNQNTGIINFCMLRTVGKEGIWRKNQEYIFWGGQVKFEAFILGNNLTSIDGMKTGVQSIIC